VAMIMPTTSELSGYVPTPVREGMDVTLYRGRQHDNRLSSRLAVGSSPHEYSIAAELNPGRGAKPLAISRHEGRTILMLKDPRGERLAQNRIAGGFR
jgi:hypothetical protein